MNTAAYQGLNYTHGAFSTVGNVLAVEVGLSIAVNGVPFTVTMQTPGDETDLVRGLLYTENIIRSLSEHPVIEVCGIDGDGHINAVRVAIASHLILKDFAGGRNVISASSCGICGQTSLDDEMKDLRISHHGKLDPAAVRIMFAKVDERQSAFQQTGGTHAAGAFTLEGEMLAIKEDIGRHNAVDKVIGHLIHHGMLEKAQCMTVSGRVSYEIVRKCLAAGIPYLAAISAPSNLAVDYAESHGITLLAFCRDDRLTIYSHPDRAAHSLTRVVTGRIRT